MWYLNSTQASLAFSAPSCFLPGLPLGLAIAAMRTVSCMKQEEQEFKASICHLVGLRVSLGYMRPPA